MMIKTAKCFAFPKKGLKNHFNLNFKISVSFSFILLVRFNIALNVTSSLNKIHLYRIQFSLLELITLKEYLKETHLIVSMILTKVS